MTSSTLDSHAGPSGPPATPPAMQHATGHTSPSPSASDGLARLASLFAAVVGLLCFLVWFSLANFSRLIEADRWNVHTYKVIIASGSVLESVVEMDTNVRSYLLSRDAAFIETYHQAQKKFHDRVKLTRSLTRDRAEQQRRLDALQRQNAQLQSLFEQAIEVRRRTPDTARTLAQTTLRARERAGFVNGMRQTVTDLQAYEQQQLKVRSAAQEKFQVETGRTLLVGGVFSIALAVGLCALVLSNTRALNQSNIGMGLANAELSAQRDELDAQKRRIEEANAELSARRDELARSNAELEQFAYVASHDLQEPLRAVAGCVQVLQKRYAGQLDARADQFIFHAVDGAQRMQNLINDLLMFSRVGTRGKPFAPADLDAVLKRVQENLSVAIRESGASITAEPLPTLTCDGGQIEQVLQNFLANALKFRRVAPSPDGSSGPGSSSGERVLLPPTVRISARHDAQEKMWVISVRDDGPGIEPKYFERIWVMFQRLHTRTEYAGTGIGLAVCKKVIERHGGHVGVESSTQEPGQGSTFWFSLPEESAPNYSAQDPSAEESARTPSGNSQAPAQAGRVESGTGSGGGGGVVAA